MREGNSKKKKVGDITRTDDRSQTFYSIHFTPITIQCNSYSYLHFECAEIEI